MNESAASRRWLIRVAQEFEVEAETADLALDAARELEERPFRERDPLASRAIVARIEEEPDGK